MGMSVDELKSELDMRGVKYEDCISKNELVDRLISTRLVGTANVDILEQFNSLDESEQISDILDDPDAIGQATSKDGSLPGGLDPAMMKVLASDKEIMVMLKDPKMQDIMKDVMTGGPDGIKKYLSDPDAMMLIQKLTIAISRVTK
eukprot:CAMPEP_0119036966 /NCGR_PEP_ID=MMETSP1177-20130426/5026_1 /TAXON_ID=2985 /ORGANISM="Ochromonas sp, Strain CCMP1899" /LENGTH=145 /DNA_ID=CAMNT_0006997557 /DNA_START=199 /DNA_END=636 /DNA_ORIENTATION=-